MPTEYGCLIYPGLLVVFGWLIVLIVGGKKPGKTGLLLLSVLYLYYVAAWQDAARLVALERQLQGERVVLTGSIERIRRYEWGSMLDLRPSGLPRSSLLRVFVNGQPVPCEVGDAVLVRGAARYQRFTPPQHWLWWDPFNLQGWTINCAGDGIELLRRGNSNLRQVVLRRLEQAQNLQPESKGLLKALLFGDRTDLSPVINENAKKTGVSHLLAISGLHLGMYVAAVTLTLRNKRPRTVLTGIILFAILSGGGASATRAVVAGLYFALAGWIGRQVTAREAFGRTLLLLLWLNPAYLFNLGFRLSIICVWGLILYNSFRSESTRLGNLLNPGLVVTAVIMPVAAAYFGVINPWGPFLTIGCAPFVFVLVLGGLAALPFLLCGVGDYFFLWFGWIIDRLTIALERILLVASRLPGVTVTVGTVGLLFMLACYSSLVFLCRRASDKVCGQGRDRVISWVCYCLIIALLQANALCQTLGAKYSPWLAVTVLNVGHGDAFYLELPGGSKMLIDGGGQSEADLHDWIGRSVVLPFLKYANCTSLDTVMISHWHADHTGGLLPVFAEIPVGGVVSPGGMIPPLLPAPEIANGPLAAQRGLSFAQAGCTGQILYPEEYSADYLANPNRASMVFRIEYGLFSLIFAGDLPAQEQKVLAQANEIKSLVLKVPHHGGHSLSAHWLSIVNPRYAIISGEGLRRGQPNRDTLAKLAQAGITAFRTDHSGNIRLRTDGTAVSLASTGGAINPNLWARNVLGLLLSLL